MKVIGSAEEFWRLRLTRVDTTDDLEFEWRDDVLYRTTPTGSVEETRIYHVEAVRLDDRDVVERLASFDCRDDAESFLGRAETDLAEMTKSQFEAAYVDGASGEAAEGDDAEADPDDADEDVGYDERDDVEDE